MSGVYDLLSPASALILNEDFADNDAVTDAAVGSLNWEIVTIGNASTLAYKTQERSGVLRATTAATADGDGTALRLFEDGIVLRPGFELEFAVRRPVELASLNWRIGLDDSVTATRPTVGVTVESDAGVLTLRTDSADHGDESLLVTGHPDLTSGTTEVVADWLKGLIRASGKANAQGGPSAVDFYLGSDADPAHGKLHHVGTVPCNIDDDEEVEPKIAFWQDSGTTDAVIVDFDYYRLRIPRV